MKPLPENDVGGSGENWEVFHAIREIIANALDEQLITGTKKIEIYQTDIGWGIRDFGRGGSD